MKKILLALGIIASSSILSSCAKYDPDKSYGGDLVDLGLSVRWYSRNLGATSTEDTGYELDYKEARKAYSARSNDPETMFLGRPCSPRIPTDYDWAELKNKCKWEWVSNTKGGGYKVTGPNGKSIFLPAGQSSQGRYLTCTGDYDKTVYFISKNEVTKQRVPTYEKGWTRVAVEVY